MKKNHLFLIILFIFPVRLLAQEGTDTTNIAERIHAIQSMLNESKNGVNGWWYGWLGAYSSATVVQGVVSLTADKTSIKQDMALGAGTTLLGAAFQLITPMNTGKDAALLADMPENTSDEKLLKLQTAEYLLKSNAMKQQSGRSWKIHALNTAVNLSSGLITWLGFKRTVWDGVANFLINTAITETQIWTQPTRLMKNYNRYHQTYQQEKTALSYQTPKYYLKTYPAGLTLSIVF